MTMTTVVLKDDDDELQRNKNNKEDTSSETPPFFIPEQGTWKRHIRFFERCLLEPLPTPYVPLDTNRLTLVHFAVQSLALLNHNLSLEQRRSIIDWIYTRLFTTFAHPSRPNVQLAGFVGGTFLGPSFSTKSSTTTRKSNPYCHVHIAMTYTALCTLATLGDDLSTIVQEKEAILASLTYMQQSDGSFTSTTNSMASSEHDMRFVYCACVICYLFNDWSTIDTQAIQRFILSCRSYDGSIALVPGQEGHGGSTFCAVASLVLMNVTSSLLDTNWREELIQWCVHRQQLTEEGGMQGRPNKAEDTCYSYWIGGTLYLLQSEALLNRTQLQRYICSCVTPLGGFGKTNTGVPPDLLHSFYSLAWLSLADYPSTSNTSSSGCNDDDHHDDTNKQGSQDNQTPFLQPLNCAIGICQNKMNAFSIFRNETSTSSSTSLEE